MRLFWQTYPNPGFTGQPQYYCDQIVFMQTRSTENTGDTSREINKIGIRFFPVM